MRRPTYRFLASSLVSAVLLFWSGCGLNGEDTCCDRGCSHDGHADSSLRHHDSVGLSAPQRSTLDPDPFSHSHVGPNGGRLIVLGGGDYHAELMIDHSKGDVTVRILDRTGRNPVGIEQRTITLNFKCQGRPRQIQLAAAECPEGSPSKSSCFTGNSDLLRGGCELTGRLNVVIAGKPYTGRVAHREEEHKLIR